MATLICGVLTACTPDTNPEPVNLREYQAMSKQDRLRYHPISIKNRNLARVCNDELSEQERLESLALIVSIGATRDPQTGATRDMLEVSDRDDLATILHAESTSNKPHLHRAVLKYLLKVQYSGLGAFLRPLMQKSEKDPEMRKLLLSYLANNTGIDVSQIISAWAKEKTASYNGDYKQVLEKVTQKRWDAALIYEIAKPVDAGTSFEKVGLIKAQAWDILAKNVEKKTLVALVKEAQPWGRKRDQKFIKALQMMINQFNYLPQNAGEFCHAVALYNRSLKHAGLVAGASELAFEWKQNYGYKFQMRDFHLLSRVKRDPERKNHKQAALTRKIGRNLNARKHVKCATVKNDNFWDSIEKLTVSDLWNIYLIDEMLSRPSILASLRRYGEIDRQTYKNSALGGLVFYDNGKPVPTPYFPSQNASNDLVFEPKNDLKSNSYDSLCRYIFHFEKVNNAKRAGPTKAELAQSAKEGWYGVVFSQVDADTLIAHYFTPEGIVVSLGSYTMPDYKKFAK